MSSIFYGVILFLTIHTKIFLTLFQTIWQPVSIFLLLSLVLFVLILINQKKIIRKRLDDQTTELKKAKVKAEKAAKTKEEFLSLISHEIRTPLNAIIGTINLMIREKYLPSQEEDFRILQFASQNLLVLINDILDYNKIEAGKIDFEEVPFNLQELIQELIQSFKSRAEEKSVKLESNISENIPNSLLGDPTRISQVFGNLINNGLKFTDIGKVSISIELRNENINYAFLSCSVKDTGIGIPREKLKVIFESFKQASTDTTRKFGGTGLGLAITQKLLAQMDSEIKVKSESTGTEFYFELRIKKVKDDALIQNEPTIISENNLKGSKILLVEDNDMNKRVAVKFLEKWEIKVDHAWNGKEAVAFFKNNSYDLILMDLQMPEMDGYEATRIIRELEGNKPKVPILALTASAMLNVKDKIINIGMNDFITKPFDPNEFEKTLNKHITNFQKKTM